MALPEIPQRTTTGFAFSIVDRAIKEGLARRQFGKAEAEEVLDFFGNNPPQCVYCGSIDVKRWDHLLPISEGGETVVGNMVPACSKCDDSKGKRYYKEWIDSNAQCSPKSRKVKDINGRINLIETYMKRFNYVPRDIDERLTQSEKKRLRGIRRKLQEVRTDIETFINDYRSRNKFEGAV